MTADKLVRWTGYFAVFAVAAVAALISYWHAVAVVGAHGEAGVYGHLYPATIDGLIVAASMVLLDAARNHEKPHPLAWWLIGAGIIATLCANVLDGIAFGFLGSIIAAWPAAALVGAYEMIMVLIRNAAIRRDKAKEQAKADAAAAAEAEAIARARAEVEAGDRAAKDVQIQKNIERWASMPMPKIPQPEPVEPKPVEPEPAPQFQLPDGYRPQKRLVTPNGNGKAPDWENDTTWFKKDPTFTPVNQETPTAISIGHVSVHGPAGRLERKVTETGTFKAVTSQGGEHG